MKIKILFLSAMVIPVVLAIVFLRQPIETPVAVNPQTVIPAPAQTSPQLTPPVTEPAPAVAVAKSPETNPPAETPRPVRVAKSQPPVSAPPTARVAKKKPEIQDPDARAALQWVGIDPEAEEYWIAAINDPDLPAEERKDLIEDLNEDGISDPHHPRPEDMPLIASRLALIEELAPYASDDVNAEAFKEAHKDLVNLLKGLPAD